MKFLRLALCVAGFSMGAGSAMATLLPATFNGVNGATAFGYYVGPYSGTLNGNPVTFYCVDFANHLTLCLTADGRIAAHLCNRIDVSSQ